MTYRIIAEFTSSGLSHSPRTVVRETESAERAERYVTRFRNDVYGRCLSVTVETLPH